MLLQTYKNQISMKNITNKELNQRGDNAILFIAMAICIGGMIAGCVRFIFF